MDSLVIFQAAKKLHPSLQQHLLSPFTRSVRHNEAGVDGRGYVVTKAGRSQVCGGLTRLLRARYYSHYKDNRSKRNYKKVAIKGSSAAQGIKVDDDIGQYVAGNKTLDKLHPMARALIEHVEAAGHVMQAAQVPVEVENGRVTQSDLITQNTRTGELWLWEGKTGAPTGLHRKQGFFNGRYNTVPCTKLNQWHLQLMYTRRALESAGVRIAHSRVIQIYEKKDMDKTKTKKRGRGANTFFVIDEHVPPAWTANHPLQPPPMKMTVIKRKKPRLDDSL